MKRRGEVPSACSYRHFTLFVTVYSILLLLLPILFLFLFLFLIISSSISIILILMLLFILPISLLTLLCRRSPI